MKPPLFSYADPESLSETLSLLAQHQDGCKVLAGGQSLMPLLNFRLVRPRLLLDINRVPELHALEITGDGVRAGATVRQREIERAPALRSANPLLAESVPLIGHFQNRTRGTVCGSLAHADPAAELPAVAIALDAELVAASRRGRRLIPAEKFFIGALTTALEPDELLCEVNFPAWRSGDGWAIEEFSRRAGDFAIAGVAVRLSLEAGVCTAARLVAFGLGGRPQCLIATEAALIDKPIDDGAIARAVEQTRAEASAEGDIHGSAGYRVSLAGTLAGRALRRARDRAGAAKGTP